MLVERVLNGLFRRLGDIRVSAPAERPHHRSGEAEPDKNPDQPDHCVFSLVPRAQVAGEVFSPSTALMSSPSTASVIENGSGSGRSSHERIGRITRKCMK